MRRKYVITIVFVVIVTILYWSGFCRLDIWLYVFSCIAALTVLVVLYRQEKKLTELNDLYISEIAGSCFEK